MVSLGIKSHKPQFSSLNFGLAILTIEMGPNAISEHRFSPGAGSSCGSLGSVKGSQL